MAPGSPLLAPHHSPTRKSSQELPLFPVPTRSNDAPPLSSPRKQTNGVHEFSGTSLLAIPEPETETADLTPSLIADEMDVDNGTTTAAEAAAAQQQQAQQQQAQQQAQQTQQQAQQQALAAPQPVQPFQSRTVRSPVRTPELQTTLPQRQAPNGNGQSYGYANGHQQQQPQQQQMQRGASQARESSPSTPGHIPPFDWEEFEARYEHALAEMNGEEKELLEEFDRLVNVSHLSSPFLGLPCTATNPPASTSTFGLRLRQPTMTSVR